MAEEKHLHGGHRARMKQRYLKTGFEGMADHEILELLLYYAIPKQDTNALAHRLVEEFGSLSGVLDAPVEALVQVEGVGQHTATLLNLLPQLMRAYREDLLRTRAEIKSTESAKRYCKTLLEGRRDETFYVISLDNQNRVLNTKKICEGTIDALSFYPRVIVETIFKSNGKKAILCHNHPSGILRPSDLDIKATMEIRAVLEGVDVALLDHVIVGAGDALSMTEHRYLTSDLY